MASNRNIVITGGDKDSIVKLLKWFVQCCQCGRKKPFPYTKIQPHSMACVDKETAKVLEVPLFAQDISNQIEQLEQSLIAPADFTTILATTESTGEISDRIISYIAEKTWVDMKEKRKPVKGQVDAPISHNINLKKHSLCPLDRYLALREEVSAIGDRVKREIGLRLADIATKKQQRKHNAQKRRAKEQKVKSVHVTKVNDSVNSVVKYESVALAESLWSSLFAHLIRSVKTFTPKAQPSPTLLLSGTKDPHHVTSGPLIDGPDMISPFGTVSQVTCS